MKLIYQFLYLICFCSLDASKQSLKNKETRTVARRYNMLVTVARDWDDEIIGFDLAFVG